MLDAIMIFSAKYLYLLIVFIAFLFFIKKNNGIKKKIIIFSSIIFPLMFIISRIAGSFYYNARPFVVNNFNPLIYHAANNGFPSDHSLISFAFASIVFLFNRTLGFVLFPIAFLVGFSRVYVGVHHAIDILGSFLISIIVIILFNKYVKPRLQSMLQ